MKTTRSKKLNKRINTVCDYNSIGVRDNCLIDTTPTETDPTNTTITIITTVNTGLIGKR